MTVSTISHSILRTSSNLTVKKLSKSQQLEKITKVVRRICEQMGVANTDQKTQLAERLRALQSRMITIVVSGKKKEKSAEVDILFKSDKTFKEKVHIYRSASFDLESKLKERDLLLQEQTVNAKSNKRDRRRPGGLNAQEGIILSKKQKDAQNKVIASLNEKLSKGKDVREVIQNPALVLHKQSKEIQECYQLNRLINFTVDEALENNHDGKKGIDSETFHGIDDEAQAIISSPVRAEKSFSLIQLIKGICDSLKYVHDCFRVNRKSVARTMNLANQCLSDLRNNKSPSLKLLDNLQNDLDKLSKNSRLPEGTRLMLEWERDRLGVGISGLRSEVELKLHRRIFKDCEDLLGSTCPIVSRQKVERLTKTLDNALDSSKEMFTKQTLRDYRNRINDALSENEYQLGEREDFICLLDELYGAGASADRALYYLETGELSGTRLTPIHLESRRERFLLLQRDIPDLISKRQLLLQIKDGNLPAKKTTLQSNLRKDLAEIERLTRKINRNDELELRIKERKSEVERREHHLSLIQGQSDSTTIKLKDLRAKDTDQMQGSKRELEKRMLELSSEISKLAGSRTDGEKTPVEKSLELQRKQVDFQLTKLIQEEQADIVKINALEEETVRLAMEINTLDSGIDLVKDYLGQLHNLLLTPEYYDIPSDRRNLIEVNARAKQAQRKLQLLEGF